MGLLFAALLPLRCAACGVAAAAGLCPPCAAAVAPLELTDHGFTMLGDRIGAIGRYAYSGVAAEAVRGMKLSGRWGAARPLGAQLRRALELDRLGGWAITWVPASPRKLRDRGMDLPRELAGRSAVPLLHRSSDGPDQTSLAAAQRRVAVHGAFLCTRPAPDKVVLVDDVRTTGATARAAAEALLTAGARRVLVVTFAVGGDAARGATSGPAHGATSGPAPRSR